MGNQENGVVSSGAGSLIEYCRTDRQRQVIELHEKGLTQRQIARELGCCKSSVGELIDRVRQYAVCKGISPEHDMTHGCPDPYIVKGTSTLYDSAGNVSAQWVKTTVDADRLRILQQAMAAEFAKTLPRYRPHEVSATKNGYKKMLAVLPLADAHLGMRAWARETGDAFDLEIGERVIVSAVTSLIDSAPACEECLIMGLGDWMHSDNAVGITERSGHNLDVDGRYGKILEVSIRVLRHVIEYAATKFPRVVLAHCKGNHDDLGALWLSAALKNVYENEPRITVLDNVSPRIYYRWNSVLLMGTHGSDAKPKDLPLIMASEKKEDWGETKHHLVLCGHIHHQSVVEVGDTVVESFDALCAKDAWSNEKGFLSKRTVKLLMFDPDKGEVMRMTRAIG